jgi:hypothetical protein
VRRCIITDSLRYKVLSSHGDNLDFYVHTPPLPDAPYLIRHDVYLTPVQHLNEANAIKKAILQELPHADHPHNYGKIMLMRRLPKEQRKPTHIFGYSLKGNLRDFDVLRALGIRRNNLGALGLRLTSAPYCSSPEFQHLWLRQDTGPCSVFCQGTVKAHRSLMKKLDALGILSAVYDGQWDDKGNFLRSRENTLKFSLKKGAGA